MGIFSKLSDSANLVHGMADRLGADLSGPVLRNPDRAAIEYRAMVLRCATCSDQPGCTVLQASCTHLDHAPDYCLNRHILDPEAA